MKKGIGIFLILALVLSFATALADNSVLRQDALFAMQFDSLNKTEAHAMQLSEGALLNVTGNWTGALEVTIKHNTGDVIFTLTAPPEPGTFVEIPSGDIYRISVAGSGAKGNLRIAVSQGTQTPDSTADIPYRLERIEGSYGYTTQYDPDAFSFEPSDAGDYFIEKNQPRDESMDTFVFINRAEGSMDEVAEALLAEDGVTETPAMLINYRAARIFHSESAEGIVMEYTLIDVGGGLLFTAVQAYPATADEALREQMQNIVFGIEFLE